MYFMLSDMLQEEEKNDDNRNQYSISHPNWKKIQTEAIHPNSDFAGLFLLVVFAVRSAVDHQLEWEKVGMWDIPERTLEKYTSGPSEMSVQIYYKMYLKNATDCGFLPFRS